MSEDPAKRKAELDREFSDVYRSHLRDVYSYAYYRVGNHHDAEDLTEQTFLQAYRHFERALRESEGRPLRPWLIRIAHNLAANLYRDRARKPSSPLEDTATLPAPHETADLAEGREELRRVLDGVRTLPADRRDALIMRFALGMDNREIARALDRSDGATKVLIHRAIRQLEKHIAEDEEPNVGEGEEQEPSEERRSADGAPRSSSESRSRPVGREGAITSEEIGARGVNDGVRPDGHYDGKQDDPRAQRTIARTDASAPRQRL